MTHFEQNLEELRTTLIKMADDAKGAVTTAMQALVIASDVPSTTLKVIDDTTEEFVKASSIQNQIVLASIDATQQNIKTFNDNAKSFVELNKNILQSWISAFATKNN